MARHGRLIGAAAAAAVLLAAPARAGERNDTEKARAAAFIRAGSAAANARQWERCIQAYSAALALDDSPATAGDLGLCEEQAGRFVDAYNHLRRATDAAPPNPTADKAAQWKRYEAAKARARKRVVILFITVSPTRAAVVLDGRPLGRVEGRHIAIEPGTHTVAARLAGYDEAVEPPRTWNAGDIPRVHLELTPKPAAPVSSLPTSVLPRAKTGSTAATGVSPAPAPVPWYETPRGWLVPAAVVSAVTLMASTSTLVGLEVDRASLASRAGDGGACGPDAASPPKVCKSLDERFQQRNTAADVAIGAAIATFVLGGAAGLAVGLDRRPTSPAIVPTANNNGGGILVLGSW